MVVRGFLNTFEQEKSFISFFTQQLFASMAETTEAQDSENGQQRQQNRSFNNRNRQQGKKFVGSIEGMNGNVFQTSKERGTANAKQFEKTVKALSSYVAENVGSGPEKVWIINGIENMTDIVPVAPEPPSPVVIKQEEGEGNDVFQARQEATSKATISLFDMELKEYVKDKNKLLACKVQTWSAIMGQCSAAMKQKLEAHESFKTNKLSYDVTGLLKTIRTLSMTSKSTTYKDIARADALRSLILCRQYGNQITSEYLEEFKARLDILHELSDGSVVLQPSTQATLFLQNADQIRFGEILPHLGNSFTTGADCYPKDLLSAYNVILDWQTNSNNNTNRNQTNAYLNFSSVAPTKHNSVSPNWILLDSASTVDLFCNPEFLQSREQSVDGCEIVTNGGSMEVYEQGYLPLLDKTVWFDQDSMANVLSLSSVMNRFPITLLTSPSRPDTHHFVVHLHDRNLIFNKSESGLFYFDRSEQNPATNLCLASVRDNLSTFNARDKRGIAQAKTLYERMFFPAQDSFENILTRNSLRNCPVNPHDATNMHRVYGRNVHTVKGKTTRQTHQHVDSRLIPVPPEILNTRRDVTLCVDLFFVDGLVFLLSTSRYLRKISIEALDSRRLQLILPALRTIINQYNSRGFRVRSMHADNEFAPLRNQFLQPENGRITLSICGANAHVPEAEREIRTIKERNRAMVSFLPFQRYPRLLKRECVKESGRLLCLFPRAGSSSDIFSPDTIVTGVLPDHDLHLRVTFGTYCEVHDEDTPTNTENERTTTAIAIPG